MKITIKNVIKNIIKTIKKLRKDSTQKKAFSIFIYQKFCLIQFIEKIQTSIPKCFWKNLFITFLEKCNKFWFLRFESSS